MKTLLTIWVTFVLTASSVASAFIICCLPACGKPNDKPRTHEVTYTLYSMNPKFTFGHIEELNTSGQVDTIYSSSHVATFKVNEDVFSNEQGVTSLIASSVDSLHIRAEFDGKKVEKGFKSTGGIFSVSVNLNDAK